MDIFKILCSSRQMKNLILNKVWTIFGQFLDNSWTIPGQFLDNSWTSWTIPGNSQTITDNSQTILGQFQENSGKILGKFRENSGKIPRQFLNNSLKSLGNYKTIFGLFWIKVLRLLRSPSQGCGPHQ